MRLKFLPISIALILSAPVANSYFVFDQPDPTKEAKNIASSATVAGISQVGAGYVHITESKGRSIPLPKAMSMIMPSGWQFISQSNVSPVMVTWEGGQPWLNIADSFAKSAGSRFIVDWNSRVVYAQAISGFIGDTLNPATMDSAVIRRDVGSPPSHSVLSENQRSIDQAGSIIPETVVKSFSSNVSSPLRESEAQLTEKVTLEDVVSFQGVNLVTTGSIVYKPASFNEIIYGGEADTSIRELLEHLIPAGWTHRGGGASLDKRVSWKGGRKSKDILKEALEMHSIGMVMIEQVKHVELMEYHLREGELLSKELKRWGEMNGWRVKWSIRKDFPIAATVWFKGDFKEAVRGVFAAYQSRGALIDIEPDFSLDDGVSTPVLEVSGG
ncbi:MAG: TcpQ domain-containing protein [Methyloprofundus sp.]|nr:TcpQ domain-containing protein [Methyloprofundus sp.]